MNVQFRASFERDLRAIRDKTVLARVRATIVSVESAGSLAEVGNVKRLRGGAHCYRIRVGDYRIGLTVTGEEAVFVRVLHRRDLYRYFP
jgi:mRNA interferase RelE/StbE